MRVYHSPFWSGWRVGRQPGCWCWHPGRQVQLVGGLSTRLMAWFLTELILGRVQDKKTSTREKSTWLLALIFYSGCFPDSFFIENPLNEYLCLSSDQMFFYYPYFKNEVKGVTTSTRIASSILPSDNPLKKAIFGPKQWFSTFWFSATH